MSHIQPKRTHASLQDPGIEVEYKITVAAFNKKTGKWEEASEKTGEKAKKFVEESGAFDLIAESQPGDVLEFSSQGLYRRTQKGQAQELTGHQVAQQFPRAAKIIHDITIATAVSHDENEAETPKADQNMPISIQGSQKRDRSPEIKVQIEVIKKTQASELVRSLRPHNKDLAAQLHAKEQQLHEHMRKLRPSTEKESSKYWEEYEAIQKELMLLTEAGHTALRVRPTIQQIGGGKAKNIFTHSAQPTFAFITPVKSIFNTKEQEIRREVQTAQQIANNLYQLDLLHLLRTNLTQQAEKVCAKCMAQYPTLEALQEALRGSNPAVDPAIVAIKDQILALDVNKRCLAIELKEVTGNEAIAGQYTIKTPLAVGDAENAIRRQDRNFSKQMDFVSDFFSGMSDLHRAGFVHGDLKPVNMLIDSDNRLKISDFGKTRPADSNASLMYTGNPRFMSVEKKLSQKGEVYSAAMIAIRILEEGLLPEDTGMLISPDAEDSIAPAAERRGIEKFACLNQHMTQTEASGLRGKVRAYAPNIIGPSADLRKAESEMHRYIDALTLQLQEKRGFTPEQSIQLNTLLKAMTSSDPSRRPTMGEAQMRFDQIKAIT